MCVFWSTAPNTLLTDWLLRLYVRWGRTLYYQSVTWQEQIYADIIANSLYCLPLTELDYYEVLKFHNIVLHFKTMLSKNGSSTGKLFTIMENWPTQLVVLAVDAKTAYNHIQSCKVTCNYVKKFCCFLG